MKYRYLRRKIFILAKYSRYLETFRTNEFGRNLKTEMITMIYTIKAISFC